MPASGSQLLGELRRLEQRIVSRIAELEPIERELAELRDAAERLGSDRQPASPHNSERVKTATASAVASRQRAVSQQRSRDRGTSAGRAAEVVRLVAEQPGMTVAQLTAALEVKGTALYRVMKQLEDDGRVIRDGRQIRPGPAR